MGKKTQCRRRGDVTPGVRRNYERIVKRFRRWTDSLTDEAAGRWVHKIAADGRSLSTLHTHAAALKKCLGVNGWPATREYQRTVPVRKSPPVLPATLRRLCRLDTLPEWYRQWAIITWAGALRPSELSTAHIACRNGAVLLTLPNPKSQSEESITIPPVVTAIDPLSPFREVFRLQRVRSYDQILRLTRAACDALGEHFTPHGFRAGCITEMALRGVPLAEIATHSRHKNLTVLQGYIRVQLNAQNHPLGRK